MGSRGQTLTLRARYILPIGSPPLENGWVRIERGTCVAVGRRRPEGPVCDLGDCVILPGLVNAHTHLEFSDLESPLSAQGGIAAWIERLVAVRRSRGTGPDARLRLAAVMRRGMDESAANGVTALGDITVAVMPWQAARGPILRSFREVLGLSAQPPASWQGFVGDLDRMVRRRAAAGVSPHAPYSVGRQVGRLALQAAVGRGLPVAMHLAESREEMLLLATGQGELRDLLESLGAWPTVPPQFLPLADWISMLGRAARGIVVHATFLGEDPPALARLAHHRDRLCVAVCPRTAMRLAGRLPPVRMLRDAGIRVAIGTDGRGSTPDLSVLAECRALADAGEVSPAEALSMATRTGAWALALEHRSGRIATGRPADLVVLQPTGRWRDPYTATLESDTTVRATLRRGRVIAGSLPELEMRVC